MVPSTAGPYDAGADGKKFIVNSQSGAGSNAPLSLVTNWASELKK